MSLMHVTLKAGVNVINEKKRVLNKERNNTFFPRCTTACNFDKYSIMITFSRETLPKSLPPGNSEEWSQNITWFLKTHFNHQFKINITAKLSYQSKIIKLFLFGSRGCGCVGRGTGGIFLFEFMLWFLDLCYVFLQVFIDSFINSFIFFFKNVFNFHAFRVLVILCSGF